MRKVNAQQMRMIDQYAIKTLGIPSMILMENAALRTIDCIDLARRQTFGIFCGTGNNGGDGLAIARGLLALGKNVSVFIIGDREKSTPDFAMNYAILEKMNAKIFWMKTLGDIEDLPRKLESVNTLIDCIFGTGLDREIKGMAQAVIDAMNASRTYTISVDMPSGINATTGEIHGTFVEADEVVCLQLPKIGLDKTPYLHAEIHVVPIGIPQQAVQYVLGKEEKEIESK